jgi:hypothetical protein
VQAERAESPASPSPRAQILAPSDVEPAQKLIARKFRLDHIVILPVCNLV